MVKTLNIANKYICLKLHTRKIHYSDFYLMFHATPNYTTNQFLYLNIWKTFLCVQRNCLFNPYIHRLQMYAQYCLRYYIGLKIIFSYSLKDIRKYVIIYYVYALLINNILFSQFIKIPTKHNEFGFDVF